MNLGSAHVFYGVGQWLVPDGCTGFDVAYCGFPVRGRDLHLAIADVINNVRGMRMRRDFLSRLHSNVEYTNVVIVEEYFVSLRPPGHFHHVLCESRLRDKEQDHSCEQKPLVSGLAKAEVAQPIVLLSTYSELPERIENMMPGTRIPTASEWLCVSLRTRVRLREDGIGGMSRHANPSCRQAAC